jgi:hypothetical protein
MDSNVPKQQTHDGLDEPSDESLDANKSSWGLVAALLGIGLLLVAIFFALNHLGFGGHQSAPVQSDTGSNTGTVAVSPAPYLTPDSQQPPSVFLQPYIEQPMDIADHQFAT